MKQRDWRHDLALGSRGVWVCLRIAGVSFHLNGEETFCCKDMEAAFDHEVMFNIPHKTSITPAIIPKGEESLRIL
jgi:hypothetical protein